MQGRTLARILLAVVLVAVAIGIGVTAYDAGLANGLAQSGHVVVTPAGQPVAPYVGYGWGYGWGFGHGFGIFGFLGTLLFIFLILGLLRAAFGGRRGWGPGGPGGPGRADWRGSGWETRAREIHDEWHRGKTDGGDKPAAG
jgi:hypothetical protein